jgi:hypothetical protein
MSFVTVNCVTHCTHFVLLLQEIIVFELNIALTLLFQADHQNPSPIALLRHHYFPSMQEVRSSRIDILVILSSLPSSSA